MIPDPPRGRDRRAGVVALALAALAIVGCPFDPRDPDRPAAPTPCDSTLSQNNPNDVRRKIVRGFECQRASIYGEVLAPDFVYLPDAAASGNRPGFFDDWPATRELGSMEQALSGSGVGEVRFSVLRFTDTGELTGDRARFDVQYEIRMVAGSDTLFYGACAFWDFVGVQTFPVFLHRWTDVNGFGSGGCTPDQPSVATESSGFLRIRSGVF